MDRMTPTDREALAAMLRRGIEEVESSEHLVYVKLTPAEARACVAALAVSAAPTPYTAAQVRRVVNDLEAEAPSVRTITVLRAGRMLTAFADAIAAISKEPGNG